MRALPLALLIAATLVAGIVLAVIRGTEQEGPKVQPTAESPTPTMTTPPPTTTVSPSPSPTTPATTDESPSPTDESPSPTEEPTEEPRNGKGKDNGEDTGPVLADTGGPPAPFLLGGAAMLGLAVALWRFSRRPVA